MNISFINNYKYKGNWSNLFYFVITQDLFINRKYLLVGLFGLFLFLSWESIRPWKST